MAFFLVKFFGYHFRDSLHPENGRHFVSFWCQKMASGFGSRDAFLQVVAGNKRCNNPKTVVQAALSAQQLVVHCCWLSHATGTHRYPRAPQASLLADGVGLWWCLLREPCHCPPGCDCSIHHTQPQVVSCRTRPKKKLMNANTRSE